MFNCSLFILASRSQQSGRLPRLTFLPQQKGDMPVDIITEFPNIVADTLPIDSLSALHSLLVLSSFLFPSFLPSAPCLFFFSILAPRIMNSPHARIGRLALGIARIVRSPPMSSGHVALAAHMLLLVYAAYPDALLVAPERSAMSATSQSRDKSGSVRGNLRSCYSSSQRTMHHCCMLDRCWTAEGKEGRERPACRE